MKTLLDIRRLNKLKNIPKSLKHKKDKKQLDTTF